MPLLEKDNSVLIVIDVQENFLSKLMPADREPLVERIAWMMNVAKVLKIPILATAEDVSADVDMLPRLKALLPQGQAVFNKMVFSLYGQKDIRHALEALKTTKVLVIGTDWSEFRETAKKLLEVVDNDYLVIDANGFLQNVIISQEINYIAVGLPKTKEDK